MYEFLMKLATILAMIVMLILLIVMEITGIY